MWGGGRVGQERLSIVRVGYPLGRGLDESTSLSLPTLCIFRELGVALTLSALLLLLAVIRGVGVLNSLLLQIVIEVRVADHIAQKVCSLVPTVVVAVGTRAT